MIATSTLIITRPYFQAQSLAKYLREHGLYSLIFPLLEICPVANNTALYTAFNDIREFALVIFVSPSAIEVAFEIYAQVASLPWPVPIAVLGPGSVKALNAKGIDNTNTQIVSPLDLSVSDDLETADANQTTAQETTMRHFDSEALLRALANAGLGMQQLQGKRVLLIRGVGGRELLAQSLIQAGVNLTIIEAYQRLLPKPDIYLWKVLEQTLQKPHKWLLTSSEAVRNLQTMCFGQPWLKLTSAIVTHPRIAEIASQIGFSETILIRELKGDNLTNFLSSHKVY